MASNKELAEQMKSLAAHINSMQYKMVTLKRGALHNSTDPQGSGTEARSNPPLSKMEDDGAESNDNVEEIEAPQGPLVTISETAIAFLEASFNGKMEHKTCLPKAKANGIPDLRRI